MNSRPPQLSKRRLADLIGIIQGPPLREVFNDLLEAMLGLPLDPYDLADFLRLIGYDELCEAGASDEMLPALIDQLRWYLSRSENELLEGLSSLRAQDRALGPALPRRRASEGFGALDDPSWLRFPRFRVLSFHDPPGCNAKGFENVCRIGLMRAIDAARWD